MTVGREVLTVLASHRIMRAGGEVEGMQIRWHWLVKSRRKFGGWIAEMISGKR